MRANARKDLQVFGSIVSAVVIYVVHNLAGAQQTSDRSFGDESMLMHVPTAMYEAAFIIGGWKHANVASLVDESATVPFSTQLAEIPAGASSTQSLAMRLNENPH